jgi:hypothetical protein
MPKSEYSSRLINSVPLKRIFLGSLISDFLTEVNLMAKKITEKDLARMWKGIDFNKVNRAVMWSINAPNCSDELCLKFKGWMDWGKRLVGEGVISEEYYKKKVKEEKFRRKDRREAQKRDEERRKKAS